MTAFDDLYLMGLMPVFNVCVWCLVCSMAVFDVRMSLVCLMCLTVSDDGVCCVRCV